MALILVLVWIYTILLWISTADVQSLLMKCHNEKARRPLALPDLIWDDDIAEDAQNEADRCIGCHHGKPCPTPSDNDQYGENLSWSDGRIATENEWYHRCMAWVNQRDYFAYSNEKWCTDGEQCVHYTQIVWEETQKVGCGWSSTCGGAETESGEVYQNTLVCHYSSGGNVTGEYPDTGDDAATDTDTNTDSFVFQAAECLNGDEAEQLCMSLDHEFVEFRLSKKSCVASKPLYFHAHVNVERLSYLHWVPASNATNEVNGVWTLHLNPVKETGPTWCEEKELNQCTNGLWWNTLYSESGAETGLDDDLYIKEQPCAESPVKNSGTTVIVVVLLLIVIAIAFGVFVWFRWRTKRHQIPREMVMSMEDNDEIEVALDDTTYIVT